MKTFTVAHPTLTSCLMLALSACYDDRVRELGNTLPWPSTPAAEDVATNGVYTDDCQRPSFVDADAVTRSVLDDVNRAPAADRPFLRYLSLADRTAANVCEGQVQSTREAFAKLLNSLSQQPQVIAPQAVDPERSVLRIDLREYGWTRPVSVGGAVHADGWEAVIATSPFAVPLGGDAASAIASETRTAVPWLSASAFVAAATSPDLYYALLGMPPTLGELREAVGLRRELDPLADGAIRAATSRSRVFRPEGNLRSIDRYVTDSGTYWEALQIDAAAFLADPLHIQPEVQRLIIFSLPNGLLAFAVTNAAGELGATAERLLDTNRDDFTGTIPTSCQNCHAEGLIPITDEAASTILSNPELFPDEVVSAYADAPDDGERARQLEEDVGAYRRALERAGVPNQGGDPISSEFLRFAIDVDLDTAAAELLVPYDTLRARLPELTPELLPLGVGLRLSRQRFGELYVGVYCALHAADANPPAAAACD